MGAKLVAEEQSYQMGSWGRAERCSGCRAVLIVPPHARAIRCSLCHALTDIRPPSHDPVRKARTWLKGMVVNFSNSISSYGSSTSYNYQGSNGLPQSYGYSNNNLGPVLRPPPSYPQVHGKKRAVLCGISYIGKRYELKGSVNDVNCMKYLLREKFGFPEGCMLVLTEEEGDPSRYPTKENLRAAMRWLVAGSTAGDSLLFHYSGHGSQHPSADVTGREEWDGLDETLCPLDYETAGVIVDDEVNAALVQPLPRGVRLHALIDACHSGTVLDLPYLCRMNRAGFYQWEDHITPGVHKGTNGGLAICFSGCDDNQTSADTTALSRSVPTGAMTYSFIKAVESEPGMSYGSMLYAMRSAIREANTGLRISGPIANLMRKVFNFGLKQEPQLSSSEKFDIYRKPFII